MSSSSLQSFSVPTSPAMTRSSKTQPVTPQRPPRHQHRHSQSVYRSPMTPSSPYTPLSLRSTGSTGSSTLTTPDNMAMILKKRLFPAGSPEVRRTATILTDGQDKSLADIADNWRSRANENGIKVSSYRSQDDSHYGDDEGSEMTMSDANDSGLVSTEEALLPPPFLSYHRRAHSAIVTRPRAQSHASLPSARGQPLSPTVPRTVNRGQPPTSPVLPRRTLSSLNQPLNLMSTPPQNRTLARQLKLKGSFTDPAQPRRREAFGPVPTPPRNIGHRNASMNLSLNHDTSLDLFDIDENDFEYEYDYQQARQADDDSFSLNLQAHTTNTFAYPTYTHQAFPTQSPFADPFQPSGVGMGLGNGGHVLSSISESIEQHFHAAQQQAYQENMQDPSRRGFYTYGSDLPLQREHQVYPQPAYVPLPPAPGAPFQYSSLVSAPVPERPFNIAKDLAIKTNPSPPTTSPALLPPTDPHSECSVCLAAHPPTLAILQPCLHPLCSTCLTSALNIVGEKDMECAVCKRAVADFKLVIGSGQALAGGQAGNSYGRANKKTNAKKAQNKGDTKDRTDLKGKSFIDPLFSSPGSATTHDTASSSGESELDSAFEFGLDFGELRASTPKLEQQQQHVVLDLSNQSLTGGRGEKKGDSNAVLRIDNVPWDITPLQIKRWLQQPVERVHVLLDPKGKTLSHAYVEVKTAGIAGAILRGEAINAQGGKKERGSVLGRGRRARGVTVTRSGQEELMADLFPSWRGSFDGSRPSLAGLEADKIIMALEGGLLTENEVSELLYLIREPDSHFLKVPALPFHSLLSLLSKFPSDVDSRVFWSSGVRDILYDVTYAAVQVLLPRVEKSKQQNNQDEEYSMDLVTDLVKTAMDCRAFTTQQIRKFADLLEACSLPVPESSFLSGSSISDSSSRSSAPRTPANRDFETCGVNSQTMHPNSNGMPQRHSQPFGDLAREFGVEAQLVEALAQRLAGVC